MTKSSRPRLFEAEHAARSLQQFAGTQPVPVLLLVVALLVAFDGFSTVVWSIAGRLLDRSFSDAWTEVTTHKVQVLLFPIVLTMLYAAARRVSSQRIRVVPDNTPAKVRALVIFLSPMTPRDRALVEQLPTRGADIEEDATRCEFQGPWRMPVEAIAFHRPRLTHVVVIPSADGGAVGGPPETGTVHEMDTFRSMIKALTADRVAVLASDAVDFEDVTSLVAAVERAYALLADAGIGSADILVDVTGGSKLATTAGAIVSLDEGRRYQYVSRRDYRVRAFDVRYTTASNAG